jgi:hypothetical protein
MKKLNPTTIAVLVAILLLAVAFGGGLGGLAQKLGGLFSLAIIAAFYFFPSIIAWWRSHHNMLAIFVLNLLLRWSGIGWIAALVWAVTASVPVVLVQRDNSIAG